MVHLWDWYNADLSPISHLDCGCIHHYITQSIYTGILAGMVQAYFNKPQVSDFESLSDDVHTAKGFWKNKVTRVLLVVILANLGSTLGTIVAGTDVIRLFFENIF